MSAVPKLIGYYYKRKAVIMAWEHDQCLDLSHEMK